MKQRRFKKIVVASLPKGHLNLTKEQIDKLRNVAEIILAVGAVAGIASIAVVAPNALQLIGKARWAHKTYKNILSKDREQKQKITRSFYYLKRLGLIEIVPKGDSFIMKITEKGQQKVNEISLRTLKIAAEKNWDGAWWMAIADIPTELRSQANLFRTKLKELNIYTLQRSVWVYPFNMRKEVSFIAGLYGLNRYLTIFKATELELEDEANLKAYYFKLLN